MARRAGSKEENSMDDVRRTAPDEDGRDLTDEVGVTTSSFAAS